MRSASAEQMAERHRAELAGLQEQLGNYRQKAGELEGNLKAVTASRDLAVDDVKVTRALLDDKHAQNVRAESLVAELRSKLEEAQRKIDELSKAHKKSDRLRAPRKPKAASE